MLEFLAHIDNHLIDLITYLGIGAYLLFFAVVMCENGIIPLIFLPGDGFLFAVGVVAQAGAIQVWVIWPLLVIAAILGYWINYWTGARFGYNLLQKRKWVKQEQLDRTQEMFNKHGKKAILICRFIPVARSIIPFLAGLSNMNRKAFGLYNLLGGVLWVSLVFSLGYFLGTIPFVRENVVWFFLALITLTTSMAFIGILFRKMTLKKSKK